MIAYIETVRPVRNPNWFVGLDPRLRFEAKYTQTADRFDASAGYVIEEVDIVKVRIRGENGSVLVPWTAISFAEEVQPVTPQPETAKAAAAPKAKQGGK